MTMTRHLAYKATSLALEIEASSVTSPTWRLALLDAARWLDTDDNELQAADYEASDAHSPEQAARRLRWAATERNDLSPKSEADTARFQLCFVAAELLEGLR